MIHFKRQYVIKLKTFLEEDITSIQTKLEYLLKVVTVTEKKGFISGDSKRLFL